MIYAPLPFLLICMHQHYVKSPRVIAEHCHSVDIFCLFPAPMSSFTFPPQGA